MNSIQRVISVGYMLGLAYSCLWVPFTATQDGVAVFRMGYGWLWAGPEMPAFKGVDRFAAPDFGTIFLHVAAVTTIAAALWLIVGFFRTTVIDTAGAHQSRILAVLLGVSLAFGLLLNHQLSRIHMGLAAIHKQSSSIDSDLDEINTNLQEIGQR